MIPTLLQAVQAIPPEWAVGLALACTALGGVLVKLAPWTLRLLQGWAADREKRRLAEAKEERERRAEKAAERSAIETRLQELLDQERAEKEELAREIGPLRKEVADLRVEVATLKTELSAAKDGQRKSEARERRLERRLEAIEARLPGPTPSAITGEHDAL